MKVGYGRKRWLEVAQILGAMLVLLGALLACKGGSSSSSSTTSGGTAKMGEAVTFDDSEWIVIEAKDAGKSLKSNSEFNEEEKKTEGRFIQVHYKVTNKGKKEEMLLDRPKVVDDKGREFGPIDMEALRSGEIEDDRPRHASTEHAEGILDRGRSPRGRKIAQVPSPRLWTSWRQEERRHWFVSSHNGDRAALRVFRSAALSFVTNMGIRSGTELMCSPCPRTQPLHILVLRAALRCARHRGAADRAALLVRVDCSEAEASMLRSPSSQATV